MCVYVCVCMYVCACVRVRECTHARVYECMCVRRGTFVRVQLLLVGNYLCELPSFHVIIVFIVIH